MTGSEPAPAAPVEQNAPVSLATFMKDAWTVPNLITLVRLLCLPLFLWLLFAQEERAAAALLLGALGATDWIDGFVARRFDQVSDFGKIFDPTVDRLLFLVGVTAIAVDGSMPVWFAVVLIAREVLVGLMMSIATLVYKIPRIDVTWWGKTATFLLMFAIPGFLLGNSDFPAADFFLAAAWIMGIPGLVLSLWTGLEYIRKIREGLAVARADPASTAPPTD